MSASLRQRSEAALQALQDGRRVARGAEAVEELRAALNDLTPKLRIDLREVQESVVEHAAMYAKNPEVLGGMLHLVFCHLAARPLCRSMRGLDLLNQWLLERDSESQQLAQRLNAVESMIQQCRDNLSTKDAASKQAL